MPRDLHRADSIRHGNVLPLPNNFKSRFLEDADGLKVIDAGETWHLRQTVITWRSTFTLNRRSTSGCASSHSRIASRILARASLRVEPCEQHPGRSSHHTATPSADSTTVMLYFMLQKLDGNLRPGNQFPRGLLQGLVPAGHFQLASPGQSGLRWRRTEKGGPRPSGRAGPICLKPNANHKPIETP